MKFIYVSDIHGNKKLYSELEKLILKVKADALIIGGDIFKYSSYAEPQLEFAKKYLYEFFKKINIKVYLIPGNCDRFKAVDYLHEIKEEGYINILSLEGTIIEGGIKLVGYANILPSPFKIKDYERRDMTKDSISFEMPCLLSDVNNQLNLVNGDFLNNIPSIEEEISDLNMKKSIWIMHSPPYGGILDKNNEGGCCGSKAIRKQIEYVQPYLTLHGHIHESPLISNQWAERIRNTISINPGSGEELYAVIFDIDSYGNIFGIKHNIFGKLEV